MKKPITILLAGLIVLAVVGAYTIVRDNDNNDTTDTEQVADTQPYSQSDEVLDEQSQSEPISIPTETTVEDPGIHEPEVKTTTFTDPSLPGFSMEYPSDWDMKIKEFHVVDPNGVIPNTIAYPPSQLSIEHFNCDEMCMGLILSKDQADVYFSFFVTQEDMGVFCSNTMEVSEISDSWYRFHDAGRYYYSMNIVENETLNKDRPPSSLLVDWRSYDGDEDQWQFGMCDYRQMNWLVERPSVEEWGGVALETAIGMKKPVVFGSPDEALLKEVDSMIVSIQGVEGRPDGIDDK